jgi:hypothetical protein
MSEENVSIAPNLASVVRTSLVATIWALAVILCLATVLMALTIVGFVVIVIIMMDPVRIASIAFKGLVLVAPITLVLLPAMTLLFHRWPRLLPWLVLAAGPFAGGWWGGVAGLWIDDGRSLESFLAILGMIGGLTGGIVFARRIPRHARTLAVGRADF